jgi:hypothetical protein
MAELPYTDESARALLNLFAELHLRPGDVVMSWQLHANFFDSPKFRAEDYAAGLSYAIEKGWLIKEGEKIKLSVSGYQELP